MSTTVTEHRAPTGYLTEAEAAEMIQVHRNTLARWRRSGYGPKFHRFGESRNARVRYRAADVKFWMRSIEETPNVARGVA